MKKSLTLLVLFVLPLLFSLSACSPVRSGPIQNADDARTENETPSDEAKPEGENDSSRDSSDEKENEAGENENSDDLPQDEDKNREQSIEETVLLDEKDIKITAKKLTVGFMGPTLELLIENNSAQNLTVQSRNASVNGYMVETFMSCDVASGKKADDELTFSQSSLDKAGISAFAEAEFSFTVFDSDTWEDYFNSEQIELKTPLADEYVCTFDDSGSVAYDKDGIKIVVKGLSDEPTLLGREILLYVENASDRPVTIRQRNLSINGFMITAALSCNVLPGKHAVDSVTLFHSDLEENEIDTIETAELSFYIFDSETWEDIAETDPVSVTF